MTLLAVALLAVALLAAADPAFADEGPEADGTAAEAAARFRRGLDLYADGKMEEAAAELERSYELSPSHRVLFTLASAQQKLERHAAALTSFERYLEQGGEKVSARRKRVAKKAIEVLWPKTGWIAVEVNVAGAEVLIDDDLVGKAPLDKLRVDVGSRDVVARAPKHLPVSKTIEVTSLTTSDLKLSLEPVVEKPVPAPPVVVDSDDGVPLWVGWATAGALGAGAIGLGIATASGQGRVSEMRDLGTFSDAEIDETKSRVLALTVTTGVLAGFGGRCRRDRALFHDLG